MDPLAQLNDIVELNQVPFWPLAWGWWLVIALLLLGLVAAILAIIRARKKSALLRASKKSIKHCQSVADVSTQLKIVALHYYSATKPEGVNIEQLSGLAWLQFLNQQLPPKYQALPTDLNEISAFMYCKNNQLQFARYHAFAKLWLQKAPVVAGHAVFNSGQSYV